MRNNRMACFDFYPLTVKYDLTVRKRRPKLFDIRFSKRIVAEIQPLQ